MIKNNKVPCKYSFLFLLLLVVKCASLQAGIITFTGTGLTVGGSPNFELNATDSVNDGLPSLLSTTYGDMKGIVTFGIDWDQMSMNSTYPANQSYIVEVIVAVKGWDPSGSLTVNTTETLTVKYNPVVNTTEMDRSIYACSGVRILRARITGIKVNGVPKLSTSDVLPKNIYLKTSLEIERYGTFNTATACSSWVSLTQGLGTTKKIQWSSMSGAEEYDVEWTYVDQYATPQAFDFINNSTRVTLPSSYTTYDIPVIYPSGKIVFRVRGRGRDLTSPPYDIITYGTWSATGDSGSVASLSSNYNFTLTAIEPDKNWQSSITFAEEAKSKQVISYYDGTQRNRQTVTYLNTESIALVGQTIYDQTGRPAIQTLPVPAYYLNHGVQTADLTLEYKNDFNQDPGGDNYTWDDFDKSNSECDIMTKSMKTTKGSSMYYSSNNPKKNNSVGNIYNYVPDANGYPFTQVEYMADNTNRIRRQSGVGVNHRLTGEDEDGDDYVGKETKYYYATPFQKQLDRLFGNEVGFYKHYKKNAVIDANGQISISYLDPQGRVIATALAGDTTNTPNLTALTSANTSTSLTVDLTDAMQVSYQDMSISATSTHFVTTAGTHAFSYTVATPSYKDCLPAEWCFDCVYDLTLSVKDECGIELVPESLATQTVGNINTACDSITFSISPSPLNLSLQVGTYVIHKKLRVNQEALDYYTEQFLANSPCILPLDSFIAEEMSKVDTMECYGGCEECLERLGDYTDHNDTSKIYDPNYDYMTQAQYNEAVEKCNKLCEVKTQCDILYEQMKNDVSPGGQYAEYEDDYTVTDGFSLLNISGGYLGGYTDITDYHNNDGSLSSVLISGIAYAPNNLTVQYFVQNWQESWAEDLVEFHPEYCYYEYCIAHESSFIYDMNMMNTGTYLAAKDSGFLNPLGSHLNTTDYPIDHKDPYFSPYSGSLYDEMVDTLDGYITHSPGYDLWEFIGYMQTNQVNASNGSASCWSDYDWSMFRAGYLSDKQKVYKRNMLADLGGGCPDFGDEANQITLGNKLPRYIFDAFGSLQNDSLTHNDINIDASSSPEDIAIAAAGFIEGNCDTICNAYAEEWMYQLRRCNGMSDADYIEIRNRLINVCRGNCDAQNPLGGIEFSEADAILTDVLGSGYATDTCNAIGIVQPVQNGPGAFGMVPMDECACDKVLEAHIQFDTLTATGNLPAGVCSEQQMFSYLFGNNASMVNFDQLECYCLQQGMIAEDTIVTNSSSGPVTTLVAPNCDAIMDWYIGNATDSAKTYTTNMMSLFNQHWAMHHCEEGTFYLSDLNLPVDFLNTNCNNCYTTYTVDTLIDPANGFLYWIKFTLHNDCGADCSFGIGDLHDLVYAFEPCSNDVELPGWDPFLIAYTDSINDAGNYINPFGNGMYLAHFTATVEDTTARMFFWTDCFNMNTQTTCGFDTTLYVPYNLACEQCLTCAMIDTAYARLLDDYPFIAAMDSSDTVQVIHYLSDYINQNYNQNFSVIQLISQLEQCDTSGQADTLEFCYEPMFSNYHNPNNECADFLISVALSNAEDHYNDYIDSVSAAFRDAYIKKCLSPVETYTMQYTDKEFHYTLYYYDQAGNLIKTVPPAGVTVITNTNTLDSVQLYRTQVSSARIMPKHKLITDYKYTTLNQPAEQRTPDGGLTKYWYDILGRLVISQNDQQQNTGLYSYTKYDDLGRIKEVGQVLRNDTAMNETKASNVSYLSNWIGAGTKTEVTKTIYDQTTIGGLIISQKNLRNRVSYTNYSDTYNVSDTIYDNATHYSYDIHGNVKELLHENVFFADQVQHFKKISYTYDLVSGNVLKVSYQAGLKDQYYHKYSYDADNRLLTAKTSREGTIWDIDAAYIYYLHGPLARVELGDNKVQGVDYAYTIHGWIKGINSNTLQIHRDPGGDARAGTTHAEFARDAAGYSIGYYEGYTTGSITYPSDYSSIRSYGLDTLFAISTTSVGSNVIANTQQSLFNGNISYMVTGLPNCSTYNASKTLDPDPLGSVYKYDQLNRIVQMKAFLDKSYLVTNNKWNTTSSNAGMTYFNNYSYDGNGNLQKLNRRGDQAGANLSQDSLLYSYATGGAGYYNGQTLNRLSGITELQSTAARYSGDLDNNSSYTYDDIGNLISDSGEEINSIEWTVYGKVKKVNRNTSSTKSNLEFRYNASGQRVLKIEKPKNSSGVLNQSNWVYTYYVHDAQGNMMGTYTLYYTKVSGDGGTVYTEWMKVNNYMLYGSSRLGIKADTLTLSKRRFTVSSWNADSSFNSVTILTTYTLPSLDANHCNRETGYKEYEITNHLGNVQATVTDRKVQVSTTPFTTITSWEPDINTIYDYYPFGAPIPGRNLALAPCSTAVSTVTDTVVNEAFTGNTGGFTAVNSTLSGATNVLVMTTTGAGVTFGSRKSFTHINGVLYTVSFRLGLGNCGGQTITVRVKDPSSGTITTQTYTTAGTKSFTFTATANGTGGIEFLCPNGTVGCTNFSIDNVLITYQSQNVTTVCSSGTDSYMFGFNGQEKLNELYGEGNGYSFQYRISDPRIARFLSMDPLTKDYPWYSPYQFAGNTPIMAKDLEGKEPQIMVDKTGRLNKPTIAILSAAFGFDEKVLKNTKFIQNDFWTGGDDAKTTPFSTIYYKSWLVSSNFESVFSLFTHEIVHRHQFANSKIGPWKPNRFIALEVMNRYHNRPSEQQAYEYGGNTYDPNTQPFPAGGQYAEQLFKYQNGIVEKTFKDPNLSEADKVKTLESVGKKFYRDVILNDYIIANKAGIENLKYAISKTTDTEAISKYNSQIGYLQSEVDSAQKEQTEITKKYGQ